MLYQPILSGKIGKWAYALIEYDLSVEPLKTLKGHILVDFIVEHSIDLGDEIRYLTSTPWKIYFNGSAYKEGQDVGLVIISSNGAKFVTSSRLNYYCTNNQVK
jgi:hypothetical protein